MRNIHDAKYVRLGPPPHQDLKLAEFFEYRRPLEPCLAPMLWVFSVETLTMQWREILSR